MNCYASIAYFQRAVGSSERNHLPGDTGYHFCAEKLSIHSRP